ncbi:MAG: enolase C-terminal domain-like protein [Candidatus Bipolaricaulota bacterium]|nr:enolase C-terminal domain-like protein [Candidatus Bipolaricaulota bacterium]
MKIERVEIIPLEVPYHRPTSISVGTISTAKNILVKVYTDDGIVGLGEVSPFIPPYTGETQETAVGILHKWIAPNLIGEDPFNIARIHDKMDGIVPGYGCTKSGVDIALYDIMGKALGVPIHKLLGGIYREKIPLWYAVSWDQGIQAMAEEAARWVEERFKGIMVKIGRERDIKKDIESIKLVRKYVGDNIPIIADPNQAYTSYDARMLAKGMSEYAQALEGPVKGWDLNGMAAVKKLGVVKLIADESLFTPMDAVELVKRDAADMLLIKLLKLGGFYKSKKIVAIAEASGIDCCCASMTNLGIGHAANLHFAASTKLNDQFGHGFENLFQIFGSVKASEERNISEVPQFKDGYYEVPKGPGLGVALIEENVKRYATERLICQS